MGAETRMTSTYELTAFVVFQKIQHNIYNPSGIDNGKYTSYSHYNG